jgi:hypothetical protein
MTQNYVMTWERLRSKVDLSKGYDIDENQRMQAPGEKELAAIARSHLFHLEDATLEALENTDNGPHDTLPPFSDVFLDGNFTVGEYRIRGVTLSLRSISKEGADKHHAATTQEDKRRILKEYLREGPEALEHASDTGFHAMRYLAIYHHVRPPSDGAAYVYVLTNHVGLVGSAPMQVNDSDWTTTPADGVGAKVDEYIQKLYWNFLDILNDPDVRIIEVKKSEASKKRRERDHAVVAPSTLHRIVLTGELKKYVQEMHDKKIKMQHERSWSHKWWVRGHFRTFRSERYVAARGKRIWILPHIKGEGVLIRKQYKVETTP